VPSVGQPGRLSGQIGVVAGQHAQRGDSLLVRADPPQRVRQGPGRVGYDEGVPRVGLTFTRIQVCDAPHRQPGQIADLDVHAASHRDPQRPNRGGLVNHHQQPTTLCQIGEQRPQGGLVVGQCTVDKPTPATVEPDRVVGSFGDPGRPRRGRGGRWAADDAG